MLCILNQTAFLNGSIDLHYVVVDGGSDDATLGIIQNVASQFSSYENLTLEYISENDEGMYDALAKGFQKLVCGDIYFYLNSGDFLSPYALEIVSGVMVEHEVKFLTGFDCVFNTDGHLIDVKLPYRYPVALIQRGTFGKIVPHIQQESTFWSGEIHSEIDLNRLRTLKGAGDYFIWQTLSRFAELEIVYAFLGGFMRHPMQLSVRNRQEYDKELCSLAQPLGAISWLHSIILRVLFLAPRSVKIFFNRDIFVFNEKTKAYERLSECD